MRDGLNHPKPRKFYSVFLALTTLFILSSEKIFSQKECGECLNPLVGVQELQIQGNIEEDGVKFMAGSGKVTSDDCSHHHRDYTTCKTEKTFRWEFKRNKRNKRP